MCVFESFRPILSVPMVLDLFHLFCFGSLRITSFPCASIKLFAACVISFKSRFPFYFRNVCNGLSHVIKNWSLGSYSVILHRLHQIQPFLLLGPSFYDVRLSVAVLVSHLSVASRRFSRPGTCPSTTCDLHLVTFCAPFVASSFDSFLSRYLENTVVLAFEGSLFVQPINYCWTYSS